MDNLRIKFKEHGRSYVYAGQDLTESSWYLYDEDGKTYADQNEYKKAQDAKKPKTVVKKKAVTKKKD